MNFRLPLTALLALVIIAASGCAKPPLSVTLGAETTARFASKVDGQGVLSQSDIFVSALSPFDRAARLMRGGPVSTKEFLEFAAQQVLPWDDGELKTLVPLLKSVERRLEAFDLPLPAEVLLIKTTGQEEGGAAYCRQNAVVIPAHRLGQSPEQLERLLIHELFHLYSRGLSDAQRDKLYGLIGFKRIGQLRVPEALDKRRITNPDAPHNAHRIDVVVDGATVSVVPFLSATREKYDVADGGPFFKLLQFRLMVVVKNGDEWSPKLDKGAPVFLDPKAVPDYVRQIGRNTGYIIHPEEVLADNFVLLAMGAKRIRTQRVTSALKALLKPPAR